jgi:charged multivesicular body protein 2B
MDNFFGKKNEKKDKKVKETLKEVKKDLRKSERNISREMRHMEVAEKKILVELKDKAKKGFELPVLREYAKQLVRVRATQKRLLRTQSFVRTMSSQAILMMSQVSMNSAISGSVIAMRAMNSAFSLTEIREMMKQLSKNNDISNLRDEILSEFFEEEEEDPSQYDTIISEILDKNALDVDTTMKKSNVQNKPAIKSPKKEEHPNVLDTQNNKNTNVVTNNEDKQSINDTTKVNDTKDENDSDENKKPPGNHDNNQGSGGELDEDASDAELFDRLNRLRS